MPQSSLFSPLKFIDSFDEINGDLNNSIASNSFGPFEGVTKEDKFYSVEILSESLRLISTTYARLSFKEDIKNDPRALSESYKILSKRYFDLSNNSVFIADAENIIKLTELSATTLNALNKFEEDDKTNG